MVDVLIIIEVEDSYLVLYEDQYYLIKKYFVRDNQCPSAVLNSNTLFRPI